MGFLRGVAERPWIVVAIMEHEGRTDSPCGHEERAERAVMNPESNDVHPASRWCTRHNNEHYSAHGFLVHQPRHPAHRTTALISFAVNQK